MNHDNKKEKDNKKEDNVINNLEKNIFERLNELGASKDKIETMLNKIKESNQKTAEKMVNDMFNDIQHNDNIKEEIDVTDKFVKLGMTKENIKAIYNNFNNNTSEQMDKLFINIKNDMTNVKDIKRINIVNDNTDGKLIKQKQGALKFEIKESSQIILNWNDGMIEVWCNGKRNFIIDLQ